MGKDARQRLRDSTVDWNLRNRGWDSNLEFLLHGGIGFEYLKPTPSGNLDKHGVVVQIGDFYEPLTGIDVARMNLLLHSPSCG